MLVISNSIRELAAKQHTEMALRKNPGVVHFDEGVCFGNFPKRLDLIWDDWIYSRLQARNFPRSKETTSWLEKGKSKAPWVEITPGVRHVVVLNFE